MHACTFTLGQLLAVYSVLAAQGFDRLAAIVLDHSRMHEQDEKSA